MAKKAVVQKDFALGATRPESIERDDVDLLNRSLKQAKNTLIQTTATVECRPGSFYLATVGGTDGVEIEPETGSKYVVILIASGLSIIGSAGVEVASFATATWALSESLWIHDLGDTVLFGSQQSPIHALAYDGGAFTFGLFAFSEGAGGSLSQPYWDFEPEVTLTVSDVTGSVTLTTDSDVFSADYVGERIRYVEREIEITSVTDGRNAAGTVITELPPTKEITVSDPSGFQVGEAVEHATLGGQGLITDITGSVITVLVTKFFTGFNGTGADLVAPNAKSNITATATASSPASTKFWDEPLISAARGYPGSASDHRGRLVLCDFPQARNVLAASSSASINDFLVGTNDDDAIVDTVSASKSQRILHCVSVEDLVILTSAGCYYVQTRDGTTFTPANFSPIKFDSMGASEVRPARVHDGVVFTAAQGENIFGAILQGDIYKAWTLVPLSVFHNHLINAPTRISSTESDSQRPEQFVFVINGDGTAAVMRWERGPGYPSESIGWVPWETDGLYKSMFIAFGYLHTVVCRTIDGTTSNFFERVDPTARLDAATGFTGGVLAGLADEEGDVLVDDDGNRLVASTGSASHLAGTTAAVFYNNYDVGDRTINADGLPVDDFGTILDLPSDDAQVGLTFDMTIEPWSRRSVESYMGRRDAKRIVSLTVMVQDTLQFDFNDQGFGGYRAGEDTSEPPALRTEHVPFYIGTREHYQELLITKTRPGPFRMTGLNYKVQV